MRQRKGSFASGLVVGLVAGLTAGMVTVAHSTTGKKAWDRFGDMFQAGYVSGFLDCVSIAKAMEREGYISTSYIVPAATKPSHFQAWVNEAYKNPKNLDKTVPQLLVIAGYRLQATFGPEVPPNDPSMDALRAVIELRRKTYREAESARKELEAEQRSDGTTAPVTSKSPSASESAPKSAGEAADAPPPAK